MYRSRAGEGVCAGAGEPTFWPQDGQNAAPWGSGNEQWAHVARIGEPHFMQKRAASGFEVPQDGQFISVNHSQDRSLAIRSQMINEWGTCHRPLGVHRHGSYDPARR